MDYFNLYNRYIFKALEGIVNVWDPMGLIRAGAPYDEYHPEIERFIKDMDLSMDEEEIKTLLNGVFTLMFDLDADHLVQTEEFDEAAERIYSEFGFFTLFYPERLTHLKS